MKKLIAQSSKILFSAILAGVMCLIIYVSLTSIFYSLGTEIIGYQTFEYDENGKAEYSSDIHYFTEGEVISYPKDGQYVTVRSEQPQYVQTLLRVTSQTLMLAIFIVFVNSAVSKIAGHDRTDNMYLGGKNRLYKGFLLGAIAAVPSVVFYIVLVIFRILGTNGQGLLQLEFMFNYPFMPTVQWIVGGKQSINDISLLRFALLSLQMFVLPLFSGVFYVLSYKRINLIDKLVYKKVDK